MPIIMLLALAVTIGGTLNQDTLARTLDAMTSSDWRLFWLFKTMVE